MISDFFIISPRGDTIIAKEYRNDRGDFGAHERSHTEAFFRKIKFWDEMGNNAAGEEQHDASKQKEDAPPVFIMPDGLSYLHVKRNGLIFGCATARNISPATVVEVSHEFLNFLIRDLQFLYLNPSISLLKFQIAPFDHCKSLQGLLWNTFGGSNPKEFHFVVRASR